MNFSHSKVGEPPHETDRLLPPGSSSSSPSSAASGAAENAAQRPRHRNRRSRTSSVIGDLVLDAIYEGIEYVVDTTHNVVENVGEVAQTVVESVEGSVDTLRESVVEEFHGVTEALVEGMKDADEGENFFLEMTLARNLSILPGDVVEVAQQQEATPRVSLQLPKEAEGFQLETVAEDQVALEEKAPYKTPVSAYFLLASAVIALSAIGPLLDLQDGCTPAMKVYWRMSTTAMILFPFAAFSVSQEGIPVLTLPQWVTVVCTSACYATMCVAFVLSLSFTAVGNAVILSNSQAIMLLVAKFLVGEPVSLMEGTGALTAFSGAVLCSKDSSGSKPSDAGGETYKTSLMGDAFALLSGMGGCGYLVLAKAVRNHVPLYQFMFLIMTIGSTLVLLFLAFVLKEDVAFSRDENVGIWGWMNLVLDRFPLEMTMVIICNMFGALGYVRAMQYFENLVISVAALMEPVVAEFLAFAFGVGFLPGWRGWLGNALVALGTLAVIAPSSIRGKKAIDP